jgi:hypothetical protein
MPKALAAVVALVFVLAPAGQTVAPSAFAARIAQLSEPAGYFDTDNLISNERSYLHVVPALTAPGLSGGAYIGVGPDQNFSYIAHVRPSVAFIVDIRRDNLLLHLLFKALFAEAPTRVEYLSLLFGRAPPADVKNWTAASVARLAARIDAAPAAERRADADARLDADIAGFGVPLAKADVATIHRFHQTFVDAGLSLKFESRGRGPRGYYPTYRELLTETDLEGHQRSYLAAEGDYAFVRSLEQRDLVVPVVGNLAGRSALRNIGALMKARGVSLSAFYTSNVEFYLFGEGSFPTFVENLRAIPHSPKSLIIRSMFDGFAFAAQPGYYSVSATQPVDDLLQRYGAGRIAGYRDLVTSR